MLRSYLKLMSIITLVFLLLSLAARALGTTQPPNPALRGFTEGCEDKPQPCWYGIVPGITIIENITSILADYGLQTEVEYRAMNDNEGYRVTGLEWLGNECKILIASGNFSKNVQMINFEKCFEMQLVQLRQFIHSDGYAYLWTCNPNKPILQMQYSNVNFYIDSPIEIPPRGLTRADFLSLFSDKNTSIQALEKNQPRPFHWRYLRLLRVGSGCP